MPMKIITNSKTETTRTDWAFIFYSPEGSGFFMLLGVHNAYDHSVGIQGYPCHQAKVYLGVYF